MNDMPATCDLCGKRSFSHVIGADGAPTGLCVEHHIQLMAVENERGRNLIDQQRHAMAMMNLAAAEMDSISGVSLGGQVSIPDPTPASSYSALNVTNSGTIGVINTATVNQISAVIGAMPADNGARDAIQSFTAAVAEAHELAEGQRRDLLEQIEAIAMLAAAKPEQRRKGVIGPILSGITQGAGAVSALAAAWSAAEPIIKAHLGL